VAKTVADLKTCLTKAKVDTTAASGSGVQCVKGVKSKVASAFANADKAQMMKCAEPIMEKKSALEACAKKTFGQSKLP